MKQLKLGILGMSPGNGHPYSWAAICNGYNELAMKDCPFPVIPAYLSRQTFPDDALVGARVTHVWTQDKETSKHIALASNIDNIVDHYEEMIGQVDGILLARDDFENHYAMSKPFLEAGLPVYIDKPLETTVSQAQKIFNKQKYQGQIFTCSALRFAKELQLSSKDLLELGDIEHIDACVPKDWNKYGIHIIDPVVCMLPEDRAISSVLSFSHHEKKIVSVSWDNGVTTTFSTLHNTACPIAIRVFGTRGYKSLVFCDTFFAFKQALKAFVDTIKTKKKVVSEKQILKMIYVIQEGNSE